LELDAFDKARNIAGNRIPPMPATIRSVASAAGVSKSTASLALRNHPSVALETRQRVESIARRLGYRINPLVAALMTQQRTGHAAEGAPLLALVDLYGAPSSPGQKQPAVRLPVSARRHLAASHSAAREAAAYHGYALDIVTGRDAGMTPHRLREILVSRGARGVILMMPPAPEVSPAWENLDWAGLSIVHLGSPSSPFHHVRPNFVGGVELVWREIGRRGYRRPGLWVPPANERYSGYRWQMALRQNLSHGWKGAEYDFLAPKDVELGGKEMRRWLRTEKIDVLCGMGTEPLVALREAGVRFPEDCGFLALHLLPDDFDQVAGLDLRYGTRFRAAVQLLDSLLRHNETGRPEVPLAMVVPARWADGPTLRPPADT
jgi:DNA-binding LacI/PurR family transcriptional regulator